MKLPRANSVTSEAVLAKSPVTIFICFFPHSILLTSLSWSLRCLQKGCTTSGGEQFLFPEDLQPFGALFPASLH